MESMGDESDVGGCCKWFILDILVVDSPVEPGSGPFFSVRGVGFLGRVWRYDEADIE